MNKISWRITVAILIYHGVGSLYIRHYACVDTQRKMQEDTSVHLHQSAANEVRNVVILSVRHIPEGLLPVCFNYVWIGSCTF
jgi:hypothetical protein